MNTKRVIKERPRVLGIITARGGSKGIPGKNIKPLLGKPLIVYTIEAARASGIFDRLILSTDDEAIANVARHYGCEAPFLRPKELAEDHTPHLPVIQHAAIWLKEHEGYEPAYVATLQPTSPLRTSAHLRGAFELLMKTGADSVVSVMRVPGHYHPLWALNVDREHFATLFTSGEPLRRRIPRRQELPPAHITNGAIYISKPDVLFHPSEPSLYGERVAAYLMDAVSSASIDTPEDWEEVERNLKIMQNIPL